MLPNFVIIGAQKSASTFVQNCLADHPEVYLPDGETPFFESPDFERQSLEDLGRIFQSRSESCLGIKRPSYIGRPEVPARIQQCLPDAKLIAVLRNPIDRAVSSYFHNVNYGFIPPIDVETGMRKIIQDDDFKQTYRRASEVIEFGLYDRYLSQYKHFFEQQQILVFLHEEIVAQPKQSLQKTYEFLGVDSDFQAPSLDSRPQKVIYSLPRLKFLTKRNRWIHEYSADRTRLVERSMTPTERFRVKLIQKVDRKILSKVFKNKKPSLGKELRRMLLDLFIDDINKLEQRIDRDLSNWKSLET